MFLIICGLVFILSFVFIVTCYKVKLKVSKESFLVFKKIALPIYLKFYFGGVSLFIVSWVLIGKLSLINYIWIALLLTFLWDIVAIIVFASKIKFSIFKDHLFAMTSYVIIFFMIKDLIVIILFSMLEGAEILDIPEFMLASKIKM
jgi:hypothetical protein